MSVTVTEAALLFPGQGSQAPGMGRLLIEAGCQLPLLQRAEEGGIELERLLVSGSAEELRPTEVAQPALFYTGVALAEILIEGGLVPVAVAGHSLGEYCAVVAAGSLTAEDGMGLVLERGRLMASAPAGTMAAVLGLGLAAVEGLCLSAAEPGEVCVVANDNAPGQVVVSGSAGGVERLTELALRGGARKVIPLNVAGAFHSPLMAGPGAQFAELLEPVAITEPRFPVATGVSGALAHSAAEIRTGLRLQLAGPVRWADAIRAIAGAGATSFLECGPGTALGGLVRRLVPGAEIISVDSPEKAWRVLARGA